MLKKFFLPFWVMGSIFLFLYSFTQVDLSLTLSRVSIYQYVEKGFQYIGWFQRPLSTYLYISVFILLFVLYFWTLRLVSKKIISRKTLWVGIGLVTIVLFFSYNAFSYDLFNYIFDAKIITHYHQNPYIHKALDFPGDPMLSFMHWTQRTYPYGPLWLVLTVPLTSIGNNIFLFTFYLFKLLMAAFFIITVYSIERIGKLLKFGNVLLPVAAFAFNPFVLSESLVSAHNDIVMMGFAMISVYFILKNKPFKGAILYILSAGIKFVTGLLLFSYIVMLITKRKNDFLFLSLILMVIGVIFATFRTNFQPWYLLYPFPFAALLFKNNYIRIPFFVFSIASVIYYIPFLYTGNWNVPIPSLLNGLVIVSIIVSLVGISFSFFKMKT